MPLSCSCGKFDVPRFLQALQAHVPAQPSYFERRHRKGGTLLPRWNLIVPEHVLTRSWEEVA